MSSTSADVSGIMDNAKELDRLRKEQEEVLIEINKMHKKLQSSLLLFFWILGFFIVLIKFGFLCVFVLCVCDSLMVGLVDHMDISLPKLFFWFVIVKIRPWACVVVNSVSMVCYPVWWITLWGLGYLTAAIANSGFLFICFYVVS